MISYLNFQKILDLKMNFPEFILVEKISLFLCKKGAAAP